MNDERPIMIKSRQGEEPFAEGTSVAGDPATQVNILAALHRNLRGRYLMTAILCCVGALGAAAAGYLVPSPRYRVDAVLRVKPTLPRIMYQSDQNVVNPMFTSFVNTQVNLLQNARVLERARATEAWKKLKRPPTPELEREFLKRLSVSTNPETAELIFVSFSDPEAAASLAAVNGVIDSYMELFGGDDSKEVRNLQITTLNQKKQELQASISNGQRDAKNIQAEIGTDDLTKLSDHAYSQLFAFDTRLAEMAMRLTSAGINPDEVLAEEANTDAGAGPPTPAATAVAAPLPSPEQIARSDDGMARLLIERTSIQKDLDGVLKNFGPEHRVAVRLRKDLEAISKTIATRVDEWVALNASSGNTDVPGQGASGAMTAQELRNAYRQMALQREKLNADAKKYGTAKIKVDDILRGLKSTQDLFDEVSRRIDQIQVESKAEEQFGRISVLSRPEMPPAVPNEDSRLKYAALGVAFGGGLPFGLMLLIGMVDRRLRYSDQADANVFSAQLLGSLPELPGKNADPEQIAAAVHTVHHIRNRLRLTGPSRKVYVVTSPLAGDGKTSLSISLAISYTAAGARTLLIDFDFVGHALTTRLNGVCDRGVGHQLATGAPVRSVVTTVNGLTLIPSGFEDIRYQSRITPELFEGLLRPLREKYDMIVVDTGPILGSLEANIAAAAADGVILVAGRGVQSSRIREAIDHLVQIGARVAGMVFNRAYAADFNRSNIASVSFRSVRGTTPTPPATPSSIPGGIESLDAISRSMAIEQHNSEQAP